MIMAQLPPSSQIKIWQPVVAGAFVGMLGALILAQQLNKNKELTDVQFLMVLLACVVLGSIFSIALSYYLARRSIQKSAPDEEELYVVETEHRKGSTSTITLRSKTSKISAITPRHEIYFEPLPYRPPKVCLTNEHDFEDTWAHDKLGDIMEDVFAKLLLKDFGEIVSRVREEVRKNAKGESDTRFRLSAFRSEGPVSATGQCETGWTLYFVREDESHACVAIVTRHELSLQYASTKEVELPYTMQDSQSTAPVEIAQLPALSQVMELVYQRAPEAELFVRGLSSNNVLVYTEDVHAIAEVILTDDGLRLTNGPQFSDRLKEKQAADVAKERWSFQDVMAWYRGQEIDNDALRTMKDSPGCEVGFRAYDNVVFRRLGRGLHMAYGAKLTTALDEVLGRALDEDNMEEAKLLVRCLAFVPTMAAMARLHSFSQRYDERIRAFSADMFKARRKRLYSTEVDLLDHLNFPDLQRAKGVSRVDSIGVISKSNDFRKDILENLARDLNLHVHRIRVITYRSYVDESRDYTALRDAPITAAWLRTKDGDCDVQINLMPSASLAQYWYVSGPSAWSVLRDIRRLDRQYSLERLTSTLKNIGEQDAEDDGLSATERTTLSRQAPALSSRSDFLKAVLMLQIWDPERRPAHVARYLIRAYRSDFTSKLWQMKRFIAETLIFLHHTAPTKIPDDGAAGESELIYSFLKEIHESDTETSNEAYRQMRERIAEVFEGALPARSGIVRPVISVVKDDIVLDSHEEEDEFTSQITMAMGVAPENDSSSDDDA